MIHASYVLDHPNDIYWATSYIRHTRSITRFAPKITPLLDSVFNGVYEVFLLHFIISFLVPRQVKLISCAPVKNTYYFQMWFKGIGTPVDQAIFPSEKFEVLTYDEIKHLYTCQEDCINECDKTNNSCCVRGYRHKNLDHHFRDLNRDYSCAIPILNHLQKAGVI